MPTLYTYPFFALTDQSPNSGVEYWLGVAGNWMEARKRCELNGGQMATFEQEDEYDVILSSPLVYVIYAIYTF